MLFSNMKTILVLGLGRSGFSAARLAAAKGFDVVVIDENCTPQLEEKQSELAKLGIKTLLAYRSEPLPICEFAVVSPGIRPDSRMIQTVSKYAARFISEIEFASWFNESKVIAITGTNGKTTIAELCVYALNKLGFNSIAAGNIGYPFSEALLEGKKYDYIVLEVSSFQLHFCDSFKPLISAIINIDSDHIDWHGSFENYAADKFKITRNQDESSFLVINRKISLPLTRLKSKVVTFGLDNCGEGFSYDDSFISFENEKICSREDIGVPGKTRHNLENALCVMAILHSAGVSFKDCPESFRGFSPGEHRQEVFFQKDGIIFVDDSKSTNPLSMSAALESFGCRNNVCLIAGGLDKNMDFSGLLAHREKVRKVFIIGKSKIKLEKLFSKGFSYESYTVFDKAVEAACDFAVSGDVVLLSPGFASMDMFKNYIERGNKFKSIIRRRYYDTGSKEV